MAALRAMCHRHRLWDYHMWKVGDCRRESGGGVGHLPFIERGRRLPFIVVGWTRNFHLGKFKIQWCQSFKFSGIEQIAAYNLKLFTQHSRRAYWKKMNYFKNSWHRHVYKRYDNVDANLWLNLPPIRCQGKAGVKITDVWHMSDLWLCTIFLDFAFYWGSSTENITSWNKRINFFLLWLT